MPRRPTEADETIGPAPRNRRRWTVVSYDIPDDKRRTQVMKTLAGYGRRVQYSVFECDIRPGDLRELEKRLRSLIDHSVDDVRFYQLCENCQAKLRMLGKAEKHQQPPYTVV